MSTGIDLHAQEPGATKTLDKVLRYSSFAFFGLVTLLATLAAAVILSYWDGVLRFLLGT